MIGKPSKNTNLTHPDLAERGCNWRFSYLSSSKISRVQHYPQTLWVDIQTVHSVTPLPRRSRSTLKCSSRNWYWTLLGWPLTLFTLVKLPCNGIHYLPLWPFSGKPLPPLISDRNLSFDRVKVLYTSSSRFSPKINCWWQMEGSAVNIKSRLANHQNSDAP